VKESSRIAPICILPVDISYSHSEEALHPPPSPPRVLAQPISDIITINTISYYLDSMASNVNTSRSPLVSAVEVTEEVIVDVIGHLYWTAISICQSCFYCQWVSAIGYCVQSALVFSLGTLSAATWTLAAQTIPWGGTCWRYTC